MKNIYTDKIAMFIALLIIECFVDLWFYRVRYSHSLYKHWS